MKAWHQLMKQGQQRGQGMTEYIIIVALIAIAAMGVITVLGDNIRRLFGTSANALSNESTNNTGAKLAGKTSAERNIKDFSSYSNQHGI